MNGRADTSPHRPLKIVMIGMGTSPHMYRLAAAVAERGHAVTVLMEDRFGAPPPVAGVSFRTFPAAASFVRKTQAVRRMLREERPDVLHTHVINLGGYLGVASGFHPHLMTMWGSDLWHAPRRSFVHAQRTRLALRAADWVLSPSAALRDEAERLAGPLRHNVLQLWGVDTDRFAPGDREAARRKLGWPQGKIVYSARALQPLYNQGALLEAWPLVLRAVPDARLIINRIAVAPAYEDGLRAKAEALGIAGSVEWRDPVAEGDLPLIYQALDVLVSLADSDGTPSTLLEAMAAGSAIVASDLPAIREWLEPETAGLLVAPRQVPAIAAALVRSMTMPAAERARMTAAARARIVERAGREAALGNLLALYAQAAALGPGFRHRTTLRNVALQR